MKKKFSALDETEINRKKKLWLAFSDLFLDTDVSLNYRHIVEQCTASNFSISELLYILEEEVAPVCSINLGIVAGEWIGFDEEWLVSRIIEYYDRKKHMFHRIRHRFSVFMMKPYVRYHWKKLLPLIS